MNFQDPQAEAQARKATREAREFEIRAAGVVRALMATPDGREWVYNILAECGVGQTPMAADAHATAFNCGQQNVGLRLQATLVAAAPEMYLQMLKEQSDGRRSPKPAADADGDSDSDYADANRHDSA